MYSCSFSPKSPYVSSQSFTNWWSLKAVTRSSQETSWFCDGFGASYTVRATCVYATYSRETLFSQFPVHASAQCVIYKCIHHPCPVIAIFVLWQLYTCIGSGCNCIIIMFYTCDRLLYKRLGIFRFKSVVFPAK